MPLGLRRIRKHSSHLRMLGAECLRYLFGSLCICFASGLFSIFECAVDHSYTCALHKHESYKRNFLPYGTGIHLERHRRTDPNLVRLAHLELATLFDSRQRGQPADIEVPLLCVSYLCVFSLEKRFTSHFPKYFSRKPGPSSPVVKASPFENQQW